MKKVIILIFVGLVSFSTFSQESDGETAVSVVEQDDSVVYKLFPTINMYNFVKLNTSTGQVYQVQWNFDVTLCFESDINRWPLVETDEQYNGRFALYPTENDHSFLLLDQFSGKIWKVQWSLKSEERFIRTIN